MGMESERERESQRERERDEAGLAIAGAIPFVIALKQMG